MMMPPPPAPARSAVTAAGLPRMPAAGPPRPALPSVASVATPGARNGMAGTRRRSSEWTADALGRTFQGEQLCDGEWMSCAKCFHKLCTLDIVSAICR